MKNYDHYKEKTALIADFVGRDFMKLARELWQLQEQKPDIFTKVVDQVGIGRRKAFALARIARLFDELGVDDERLNKIGWAKLNRISGHLEPDNAEQLLILAEENTAYGLDAILKGEQPIKEGKFMLLCLPETDHKRLCMALIDHGAKPAINGGLSGKEAALIHILDDLAAFSQLG